MNKVISSDVKLIITIFCISLSLRLFFALNSRDPIIKDGATYDSVAVSLISGKGFSLDGVHPTSAVPPLYPYLLASIYAVFGHNFKAALFFQSLFGALTCVLIFLLTKEVFRERIVAFLAGMICSLYYYFIKEGERLWTEPIFIFLITLAFLLFVKMSSTRNIFYAAGFGLACAFFILTRPGALFLPFLLMLAGYFRIRPWNKKDLSVYARYLSVALFFLIVPVALWSVRNFMIQKEFVLVATGGGANLYEAFNPYQGKKYGITVRDEVIKQGESMSSEVLRDRFYFKKGLESFFHKAPSELTKLTMIKALTFWSLMEWGAMADKTAVFNFCTAFILPFSIMAIFLLRRSRYILSVLLLPLLYFFFFSLVFMGHPRFRMPAEPFLIILAAYAIAYLFQKSEKKIIPSAVIFSWLGINLALFMGSGYVKYFFKKIMQAGGLW